MHDFFAYNNYRIFLFWKIHSMIELNAFKLVYNYEEYISFRNTYTATMVHNAIGRVENGLSPPGNYSKHGVNNNVLR